MNALATDGSKNLKHNVPNPKLKSNIPPNKKEVRRSAIYSTLKVRFNKQPNKSRYHRSKKDQRDCDHKFHLEAI